MLRGVINKIVQKTSRNGILIQLNSACVNHMLFDFYYLNVFFDSVSKSPRKRYIKDFEYFLTLRDFEYFLYTVSG